MSPTKKQGSSEPADVVSPDGEKDVDKHLASNKEPLQLDQASHEGGELVIVDRDKESIDERTKRFVRDALAFKNQRRPQMTDSELEDWELFESASHTSDQGKSAEVEVLENLPDVDIKRALASIPEEFRMAVYLVDVEGFSYKEAAEIIGIPTGTIMSRLHRGRKQLRELLAEYARELGYGAEKKPAATKGGK